MRLKFIFSILFVFSAAIAESKTCPPYESKLYGQCISKEVVKVGKLSEDCSSGAPATTQAEFVRNIMLPDAEFTEGHFEEYFEILSQKLRTCNVALPAVVHENTKLETLDDYDAYYRKHAVVDLKRRIENGIEKKQGGEVHEYLTKYRKLSRTENSSELAKWELQLKKLDEEARKSCTPRDFSKVIGSEKNQGHSKLCYAVTLSNLIYAKTKIQPSYIDIGVRYHLVEAEKSGKVPTKLSDLDEGFLKAPLDVILNKGMCPATKVPDDKLNYDLIKDALEPQKGKSTESCACENKVASLQDQLKSLRELAVAAAQSSAIDAVVNTCREHRIPLSKNIKAVAIQRPFTKGIDEALTLNNPVGVGGDSTATYFADHALTIVGRQWNAAKHTCEYALRDNYSGGCDKIPEEAMCKDGLYHLTRAQLDDSIREAVYLK